jgi:hypothetical protein
MPLLSMPAVIDAASLFHQPFAKCRVFHRSAPAADRSMSSVLDNLKQ